MPPVFEMKLELVPVPVSDIDRAKAFYADQVGFRVDHDVQPAEGVRGRAVDAARFRLFHCVGPGVAQP